MRDAVINGICDRFRAVTLTSLTTVLGLTPLLFETSVQAQFLLPMVITIAWGLAFASLIVLFLVLGSGHAVRLVHARRSLRQPARILPNNQRRQKLGANKTSTVRNSNRPRSMPKLNTHLPCRSGA